MPFVYPFTINPTKPYNKPPTENGDWLPSTYGYSEHIRIPQVEVGLNPTFLPNTTTYYCFSYDGGTTWDTPEQVPLEITAAVYWEDLLHYSLMPFVQATFPTGDGVKTLDLRVYGSLVNGDIDTATEILNTASGAGLDPALLSSPEHTSRRHVQLDSVAPVLDTFTGPLTYPGDPWTYLDGLQLIATDAVGLHSYLIKESSTTPVPEAFGEQGASPTRYQVVQGGTVTLYAWARDLAGNVSNSLSLVVEALQKKFYVGTGKGVVGGEATVVGNHPPMSWESVGGSVGGGTTYGYGIYKGGIQTISVLGAAVGGGTAGVVITTAQNSSLLYPTNARNIWLSGEYNTAGSLVTVTTPATCTIQPVEYPSATTFNCQVLDLPIGTTVFTITATDKYGQSTSTTKTIVVSTEKPFVSINYVNSVITSSSFAITGSVDELCHDSMGGATTLIATSGIKGAMTFGAAASGKRTFSTSLSNLPVGFSWAVISAQKSDGTYSNVLINIFVVSSNPTLTINNVLPSTSTTTQTLSGKVTYGCTVHIRINEAGDYTTTPLADGSWSKNIPLSVGNNTVVVYASNARGRTSDFPFPIYRNYDEVLFDITTLGYSTTNSTSTITGIADPRAVVVINMENGTQYKAYPNSSGVWSATINLAVGENHFYTEVHYPGRIFYTTDGTDPTESSRAYTGPLTIRNNALIKAIAVDKSGNVSPINTQLLYVDVESPVSHLNPLKRLELDHPVFVSVYTTDSCEELLYALNDSVMLNPTVYTKPFLVTRDSVVEYRGVDNVGNLEGVNAAEFTFKKSERVVITPGSGTYNDNLLVYIRSAIAQTTYYTLDGSEPTNSSAQYVGVPILFEVGRKYTLRVRTSNGADWTGLYTRVYDLTAGETVEGTNIHTFDFAQEQTEDVQTDDTTIYAETEATWMYKPSFHPGGWGGYGDPSVWQSPKPSDHSAPIVGDWWVLQYTNKFKDYYALAVQHSDYLNITKTNTSIEFPEVVIDGYSALKIKWYQSIRSLGLTGYCNVYLKVNNGAYKKIYSVNGGDIGSYLNNHVQMLMTDFDGAIPKLVQLKFELYDLNPGTATWGIDLIEIDGVAALEVVGTYPAMQATSVYLSETLQLTFSEEIDPACLTDFNFILTEGTEIVPCTYQYKKTLKTVYVVPSVPMKEDTVYGLVAKREISSRYKGQGLAADYILYFTTGLYDIVSPTLSSFAIQTPYSTGNTIFTTRVNLNAYAADNVGVTHVRFANSLNGSSGVIPPDVEWSEWIPYE